MLHDVVNDHWVRVHTSHATMLTMKKSAEWCSISMHACGSVFYGHRGLLGSGCWSSAIKVAL